MVAYDQGHKLEVELRSKPVGVQDCAGYVVPAVSLFGDEAPRVLRNPIGTQGTLGQSLWVRGTPFNEGN